MTFSHSLGSSLQRCYIEQSRSFVGKEKCFENLGASAQIGKFWPVLIRGNYLYPLVILSKQNHWCHNWEKNLYHVTGSTRTTHTW